MEAREGAGSLGTGLEVVASQCGCWESNSGSLKEQQVLLTDEPSL